MMRRHHENRISFDFPRDGKQNQFASLTKTIPSRSNRKAVTLPLIYHKSFMIHRGDRRGNSPFCWRSRNQEVPCESLVPFFSQERNCQCGRHEPTKAKTFLKLCFEAECIYSILLPAPNGSLHKTKVSLWAYAAHPCGYFSFTRKVSKSVSKRKYPL